MIERYARDIVARIWQEPYKLSLWLEIELLACEGMESLGEIPNGTSENLRRTSKNICFTEKDIEDVKKIEGKVKHDVIAFLTFVAQKLGPEARFLHQGLTSSDILDTTLSLQLLHTSDILIKDLNELLETLKAKAFEHKDTVCIGRSHGIHAEAMTFGLKMAQAYCEFSRCLNRLKEAREEIRVCAISGAVGTFANVDPRVEGFVAQKLGLKVDPLSTQVIARDRHAFFFSTLGIVASCIERLATEVRHLQRSEVAEAEEFFSDGQKGSSAMPHKRNPVLSENLVGLARLIRGYSIPAMENIALWHERDISHSSVERIMGPDATVMLDFSLHRLNGVIKNLIVYPAAMMNNLNRYQGLVFSQKILLALTQKGVDRQKAYESVQVCAMNAWHNGKSFKDVLLKNDNILSYLSPKEVEDLFDMKKELRHVSTIFKRVFIDVDD